MFDLGDPASVNDWKLAIVMLIPFTILLRKYRYIKNNIEPLNLEVKEKDRLITALKCKCKSFQHGCELLRLKRLEDVSSHHIRCQTTALEHIPKCSDNYLQNQQILENDRIWDLKIGEEIQKLMANSDFSDVLYEARISDLLNFERNAPLSECQLENYVNSSPVEDLFWENGNENKLHSLKKQFMRLKGSFPNVSKGNLKEAIFYIYNKGKSSPRKVNFNQFDKVLKKMISQDSTGVMATPTENTNSITGCQEWLDYSVICFFDLDITCKRVTHSIPD